MRDFGGRTAFVTGAARGIGFAIATALAHRGVKVAITDADADALTEAETALKQLTEVRSYTLDVRDRKAFSQIADRAEAELGRVTLLFNNAGIGTRAQAEQMSYESWDLVIGINLGGVINGLQTFVPRMLKRGGDAHVVNTSSAAGLVDAGEGYLYQCSKYGVVGLSEALREELQPKGIGLSVLCPGPVATDIVTNSVTLAQTAIDEETETHTAWHGELNAWRNDMPSISGIEPGRVAEILIEEIEANAAPWIFTDDLITQTLQNRMQALLDALSVRSVPE